MMSNGFYWVKVDGEDDDWEVAYFFGSGWDFIGIEGGLCYGPLGDRPMIIGPKIEEPK